MGLLKPGFHAVQSATSRNQAAVTIRNGQGEALPRHRGFKSAIRNVTRFSFQSADRCKVKDFLRVECVSIDVRLLKCTRICRNPRDNGTRICPMLLLCMAYYYS